MGRIEEKREGGTCRPLQDLPHLTPAKKSRQKIPATRKYEGRKNMNVSGFTCRKRHDNTLLLLLPLLSLSLSICPRGVQSLPSFCGSLSPLCLVGAVPCGMFMLFWGGDDICMFPIDTVMMYLCVNVDAWRTTTARM